MPKPVSGTLYDRNTGRGELQKLANVRFTEHNKCWGRGMTTCTSGYIATSLVLSSYILICLGLKGIWEKMTWELMDPQ